MTSNNPSNDLDENDYRALLSDLRNGVSVYLSSGRRYGKMKIMEELSKNCLGCGRELNDEDRKAQSATLYKCPSCGATSALVTAGTLVSPAKPDPELASPIIERHDY